MNCAGTGTSQGGKSPPTKLWIEEGMLGSRLQPGLGGSLKTAMRDTTVSQLGLGTGANAGADKPLRNIGNYQKAGSTTTPAPISSCGKPGTIWRSERWRSGSGSLSAAGMPGSRDPDWSSGGSGSVPARSSASTSKRSPRSPPVSAARCPDRRTRRRGPPSFSGHSGIPPEASSTGWPRCGDPGSGSHSISNADHSGSG